ncbi:glycoside hydrolase family 6 protein [Microbispora sp. KK1-11]|uniref:glycoside hydrolase family 6 protein n=1 Tax=Microbispora sp. KK1-11 TaxID=2053005 RepID=UPI001157125B|nr:glycoside hydrolase family 6 protein [Microbispora sp. KK1-11]TQS26112.1 protein kinase [Microbispora sp. KK1-11]
MGPYRLLRRLGEGGMGTVYLGEAPDGTRVAVKLLHHSIAADPDFRRRFRREVEAAKRVARFCTAAVLDAEVDGETVYLVTEYVPGPTLKEAVERDGPLRGSSLDGLAVSIATALRAIHAAGIIHRDLKPGNVLLSPIGPKVIDFGIAHLSDMAGHMSSAVVGTPSFMSPEQFEGGLLTPASDVFAWASTITYAGTGHAPFGHGSLPVVVNRVVNGEPDLTGLDGPLGTLVARALAKNPAERPTVQDILDTLTGSAAPSVATLPGGGGRRRRSLMIGTGAGALAVVAAVAATWLGTSSGPTTSGSSATSAASVPTALPSVSAADTRGNPLREPGVRFAYKQELDPQRQADLWDAQGRKTDAALMRALAAVPHSVNLNMPVAEVKDTVTSTMRLAAAHDAVPVFLTDYVPLLDCSDRGAPNEQTYKDWIDRIAAGIGAGRAVVVLEPNSLTELPGTGDCPSGGKAGMAERYHELGYAVDRLGKLAHTAVYLDGGIEGWPDFVTMADRLVNAGVERADGFYLNSSDFQHTDSLLRYGDRLSRCVYLLSTKGGGTCADAEIDAVPADAPLTHFVIDTSRNGKGVWDAPEGKYADPQLWCNPPGRGVGLRPTTDTGNELADAFLWIRHPGESSGRCLRGGPGPEDPVYHQVDPVGGTWWPALALERARNAVPPLR